MTDIMRARQLLPGHSICICRGEEVITDDGRGIGPMMRLIAEGRDLRGSSCADLIVGKAAAMLFVKAGAVCVHGEVMSAAGRDYLAAHGIQCSWGTLTERIIDRQGKDTCPMEKTVAEISDCEAGYEALRAKLEAMRAGA
ncbi:MAG: DUF1893 domain-containing protein [Ruminococcus sp.]|nr:DUF1893 domain-containing protein [Ruminococcus sp.]